MSTRGQPAPRISCCLPIRQRGHSSGIVSQGRIGAIIGARPVDRRALLEEAANIRGLHARKRERNCGFALPKPILNGSTA